MEATQIKASITTGGKNIALIIHDADAVAEVIAQATGNPGLAALFAVVGHIAEEGIQGWEDAHAIEITADNILELMGNVTLDPPLDGDAGPKGGKASLAVTTENVNEPISIRRGVPAAAEPPQRDADRLALLTAEVKSKGYSDDAAQAIAIDRYDGRHGEAAKLLEAEKQKTKPKADSGQAAVEPTEAGSSSDAGQSEAGQGQAQ